MIGARRFADQQLFKRREQEVRETDLRRHLADHRVIGVHSESAHRVEGKRRARSEASERRELHMDYTYAAAQQDKHRRSQAALVQEHLAEELSRRRGAQQREEMERRRVCAGSEELRVLKERLNAAKVNKERAMQLVQQNVRDQQEQLREQRFAEHMEDERLEHIELEHKLNSEKSRCREHVRHTQQQQMAMKDARRRDAASQAWVEREQVDELVGKIAQEDVQEVAFRRARQLETRAALDSFRTDQRAQQEARERAERQEFERIERYGADKRVRDERAAAAKAQQEWERSRVVDSMVGQMEAKRRAAEEWDQLRNDLYHEEREEEHRRREEMQARKKQEDRQDMRRAHQSQMRLKEERTTKAREEEERYREELMRKFAEDERLEQMNDKKRRMRVEAHKREAQRLVEVRRDMYEQQRHSERQQEEVQRQEEERRRGVIEEERRRLLLEQGSDLVDFMPRGTLENREEYAMLRRSPLAAGGA